MKASQLEEAPSIVSDCSETDGINSSHPHQSDNVERSSNPICLSDEILKEVGVECQVSESFSGTPEGLLENGKQLFRSGKFNKAINAISLALEKKIQNLGGRGFELHPDLSEFYIWFGDALLTKEERSNELFSFFRDSRQPTLQDEESRTSNDSNSNTLATAEQVSVLENVCCDSHDVFPSESNQDNVEDTPESSGNENVTVKSEEAADEGISDEQLAFENLEIARLILSTKLSKSNVIDSKMIQDLSFVHIRLADIYLMNDKYKEAAMEYQLAVKFREKYNEPKISLICPNVSLGQAHMFSGGYAESIDAFKKALDILTLVVSGEIEVPAGRTLQEYINTKEDILLQISELESKQNQAQLTGAKPVHGSQSEAAQLIPVTTNCLDTPQLTSAVIDLGVLSKTQCTHATLSESAGMVSPININALLNGNNSVQLSSENVVKKRRIDISSAVNM